MEQEEEHTSHGVDQQTETEHTGVLPADFFSEDYFSNNDQKICYYTRLPNKEVLVSVFELVVPYPGARKDYYWRSFVITLMRLRLNAGYQELAYRMGVSVSTLARRFQEMHAGHHGC